MTGGSIWCWTRRRGTFANWSNWPNRRNWQRILRLLYVSLTRAKNRCYLIWGRFRDAETSSLAYLLYPPGDADENIVEEVGTHFQAKTDEMLRQDLKRIGPKIMGNDPGNRSAEEPRVRKLTPAGKDWEELPGRVFSGGLISRDWQIASFSRLTVGYKETFDSPQEKMSPLTCRTTTRTLSAEEPVLEPEPFSIFAFPRGAKAGSLLHDLLENLDFTEKDSAVIMKTGGGKTGENMVLIREWQETIAGLIGRVLATRSLHLPRDSPWRRFPGKNG